MAEEATARGAVGPVLKERLADAVRRVAWATSGLVIVIGEPVIAEAAWNAVLDPLPGRWRRIWRPAGAGDLLAGLRAVTPIEPWTVIRVADLRTVLMPDDVTLAVEVAATLRGVLGEPTGRPLLVAATMPPDRESWRRLQHAPASGGYDQWAQARALLQGALVLTADLAPGGGVAQPAPAPAPAPEPEPEPEPAPEPEPVHERETGPEHGAESGARPGAEPGPEPTGEPAQAAPEPEPIGGQIVVMTGAVTYRNVPRWMPSALPVTTGTRLTPEEARRLGLERQTAGDTESAVRWYERAAQEGDLVALERLASLRAGQAPGPAAEQMFRRAAQERNTAVLFGLAAVGHQGALELLRQLRGEARPTDPQGGDDRP